ncbi:MAG: iron-containing alcohol dehydrogenase [Deltaproteobacteria bacterium]|nr:iron-containing alcohol dehydrogenase [Deltaproteobacteria bacterium]
MLNFTFHNPTKVFFGKDAIRLIAGEIPRNARVMIVYGGAGARASGALDDVLAALRGYDLVEFGGIAPNPDYDLILPGVELAREKKIDWIVAVGGGSVIDAAKFMSAAVPFADDPFLLMDRAGAAIRQTLPVGAVVTLPASGSEMNSRAILSRKAYRIKKGVMNPLLHPRFAALDPTKTYTLPCAQIGNGVVDTFAHVLEQYLTYPAGGEVQDRLAEGLLHVLIDQGPKALVQPQNYDVRANLMWAATLGLNGLIGAGVPQDWSAHRLGYELTVLYGLAHAETLACLVPAMLAVRLPGKREKLLQYGERIWGLSAGGETKRLAEAIGKTRAFFEAMGLPTRFAGYGLTGVDIERVAELLAAHGMVDMGERQDVTLDMMRDILKRCL